MNKQVKELVASCSICDKFKRSYQEKPPKYPFHVVAMDLFEYAGRDFVNVNCVQKIAKKNSPTFS